MEYYFIANIMIHDENEYSKYLGKSSEVFNKYNGTYLSVDKRPVVLEGEWGYSRLILIKFPNENDFNNWYNSKDYQEILKYRLNAARCDTILAKGNMQ
jgi:uncharacterized protein (DUF1330 family)